MKISNIKFLKTQNLLDAEDFPGGSVVKKSPANAGDMGWIPHAAEPLSPCATTTEPLL